MGSLYCPFFKNDKIVILLRFEKISKSKNPEGTKIDQCFVEPLPLPIRTSIGLAVIGMLGKILNQILPCFLKFFKRICFTALN